MRAGSLEKLVAAARALPGERVLGASPTAEALLGAPPMSERGPVLPLSTLRARLGELLGELGRRVEPALAEALEVASRAWDQVDALVVLDEPLRLALVELRGEWQAFAASSQEARGPALEALLTLEAAVGLVRLVERRLATLIRLRLRSEDPGLSPGGRPFLDVGGALAEAARGWR